MNNQFSSQTRRFSYLHPLLLAVMSETFPAGSPLMSVSASLKVIVVLVHENEP